MLCLFFRVLSFSPNLSQFVPIPHRSLETAAGVPMVAIDSDHPSIQGVYEEESIDLTINPEDPRIKEILESS
jgi:hypothetical protein